MSWAPNGEPVSVSMTEVEGYSSPSIMASELV